MPPTGSRENELVVVVPEVQITESIVCWIFLENLFFFNEIAS